MSEWSSLWCFETMHEHEIIHLNSKLCDHDACILHEMRSLRALNVKGDMRNHRCKSLCDCKCLTREINVSCVISFKRYLRLRHSKVKLARLATLVSLKLVWVSQTHVGPYHVSGLLHCVCEHKAVYVGCKHGVNVKHNNKMKQTLITEVMVVIT